MITSDLEEKIAELGGDLYMLRTMRETLVNRGLYPEIIGAMDARIGNIEIKLGKLREMRDAREYARKKIQVVFPEKVPRPRRVKR